MTERIQAAIMASILDLSLAGSSSANSSRSSDSSSMSSENTAREEEEHEKLCIVCMDRPYTVVFGPCGHRCICLDCKPKIDDGLCPYCRLPFEFTIDRVYDV